MFADDAVVYNTRSKRDILQNNLTILSDWSNNRQLHCNTTKRSVISIGECQLTIECKLNGTKIQNVNSHTYVGVEITSNLTLQRHIDKLSSKSLKMLSALNKILKSVGTKT